MNFIELDIEGAYVIELAPIRDSRGFFCRTFCSEQFKSHGLLEHYVQINHSQCLNKGTIRGLHYQTSPHEEAKLLRCLKGSVQDVLVDVRRGSATFLQWHSEVLSANDFRLIYVPPGCAHGFQALEDTTEVTYQASTAYAPDYERQVRYNDPRLGIKWLINDAIVSDKDANSDLLTDAFRGIQI